MDKVITPVESFRGQIEVPGDKSISHRVVLIGGISEGLTEAVNFLRAEDSESTVSAFRDMGIPVELKGKKIIIRGRGLRGLRKPRKKLFLGNSGTSMRILPGVLAGQDFRVALDGDRSLRQRPMARIIDPLTQMGLDISSVRKGGYPPLVIKGGRLRAINYSTKVASAQVKSCILFAGLYAAGTTKVTEPYQSRDHTERMLKFCGAPISKRGLVISVTGGRTLKGKKFFVPGDISSASFFIAASCMLKGSEILIRNVGLNPTRLGFINILRKMGANIKIKNKNFACEPYGDIQVKYSPLRAALINKTDLPLLIDEVPVLAVLASRAEGKTIIKGIAELRVKETDRVASMVENLNRVGVRTKVRSENWEISGGKGRFDAAALDSFGDHRTAMAMAVASLFAKGICKIKNTACVKTSFPEFFDTINYLKR